ncbi:L,D-transpeptidase [Streptomyces sp. NPDC001404]|uniref:L,D-transpeptidase n=1 Tax=Streptomyces sp. NPDC001404 TaxID=3364571 RepID=UPI0036B6ED4B
MMRARSTTAVPFTRAERRRLRAIRLSAVTGAGLLLLTACGSGDGGDNKAAGKAGAAHQQAAAPAAAAPKKVTAGPLLDFDLTPGAGKKVGTGQPVSLEFYEPVKNKAAVERALTVTASNATEGSWGWVTTTAGRDRLDWRPKNPWKPNTDVTVKGTLTTVDPGGAHFERDIDRTFTVGRDQQLTADLDTHRLIVEQDGKQVKSIPMSGGEPVTGRASRRGTFAIKSQERTVHMTSASVGGPKKYDVTVNWGMRFSDSGGFLHQATDDAQQYVGNTNHSAGCIGMTPEDAQWLFENTLLGDLVTVKGEEATGELGGPGNGYADWSVSYDQWKAKSAAR